MRAGKLLVATLLSVVTICSSLQYTAGILSKMDARYNDKLVKPFVIGQARVSHPSQCVQLCSSKDGCLSVSTGNGDCYIYSVRVSDSMADKMEDRPGLLYYVSQCSQTGQVTGE